MFRPQKHSGNQGLSTKILRRTDATNVIGYKYVCVVIKPPIVSQLSVIQALNAIIPSSPNDLTRATPSMKEDSEQYRLKKKHFDRVLTIYGRKTVLEALQMKNLNIQCLHLADTNRPAQILAEIRALAEASGAEIKYYDRMGLSRISKNAKQDQGVALDILPARFEELKPEKHFNHGQVQEYIALDGIANPQNLGMIIRSVSASSIAGLILPRKGCAKLDALVIKASAGTLFKAPILRCASLDEALSGAQDRHCAIVGMDLNARHTLRELTPTSTTIFVLGNESEGLSKSTRQRCTQTLRIPMYNDVESLNVAVTAGLIALRHQI